MRKLLMVMLLVTGSVFLGSPSFAEVGDGEAEASPVVTESPQPEPEVVPPPEPPPAPPAEQVAEEEPIEEAEAPADQTAVEERALPTDVTPPPAEQAPTDGPVPPTLEASAARVGPTAAPDKVWVCKYVTKPGEAEVLKEGKNPISVSVNSTEAGDFNDGQERSKVVGFDDGGDPPTCPAPGGEGSTVAIPLPPIIGPPTCTADGTITPRVTTGVTYTISPIPGVPGTYTVTATADEGYSLDPAVTLPFTVTVLPKLTTGCPGPAPVKKVFICKYVGKPGVDERLQTGGNPIEVSVNALPGSPTNPQVGQQFVDAQGRSVVIALSPADPEPTIDSCLTPPPILPPGPREPVGQVTVTPVALTSPAQRTRFENVPFLPATGGLPLWMLLVAGPMTVAGGLLLMRRRPVAESSVSGGANGVSSSLIMPPQPVLPATAPNKVGGVGTAVHGLITKVGNLLRRGR